jgi:hypothetical protein
MGYANRVIRLDFPDLTDDPVNDKIWVTIRNPKLVPSGELTPEQVTPVVDGQAEDAAAANASMHKMFAKLIIGWRAYDASEIPVLDAAGNPVGEQALLPMEYTEATVAKLPMEILNAIGREVTEALNPR